MFGGLFARRVNVLLVALLVASVLVTTTDNATAEAQAGGGGCIDELEVRVTSENASVFGFVTIPPGATFSTLIKHRISGTNSNGFNSEIRLSPARTDGFPGHDVGYEGFAADGPWTNSEMDDGSFAWTNPADATQTDFILEVGYWNRPFNMTGWTKAYNFLVTPVGDPGVPACVGAYTPPDVPATICDAWPTLFSNGGAVESAPFEMPADGWFGFNSIDTFPRREYEGGDKWPYVFSDWIAQVELWALVDGVWELEDDQGTITENIWVRDAYVSSWSNLRNRSGSTTVKIRMYERFGPSIPATSTLLNVSTAPNGESYEPFCPGDPVANTDVEFGAVGCAAEGTHRGTFDYTVTNNSGSTQSYKLIAGPHGHDPLVVGAGETVTFTLEGIPDGIHDVSVELDGEVVDTLAGVEFDCAQLESSVTIGIPGCAADPVDGATLSFTVTNGELTTQSFRLIVGPHGHFPLVIAPSQTETFVLQGIPLGTWPVSVEFEDGTVVGSTDGVVFECSATRPTTLRMRFESGATDGLGPRMQATWQGQAARTEVRWFYDMTSTEIRAAGYENYVERDFVVGTDDSIVPDEPGTLRNRWCVAARGAWGDDTSSWIGPRCARSVKCIDQLATVILGRGETPTLNDDVIYGTNNADTINSGDGDDLICGRGGNDIIDAGDNNDTVYGGSGDDIIDGSNDNDTIRGGSGNDQINGNWGADILYGEGGADTITGGPQNDTIDGGPGRDQLAGETGNDLILGGRGNDLLDGGDGIDEGNGQAGTDVCPNVENRTSCEDELHTDCDTALADALTVDERLEEYRRMLDADRDLIKGQLAFQNWEDRSGRLDPLTGSSWWRTANGCMILDMRAALDHAIIGNFQTSAFPRVQAWLDFYWYAGGDPIEHQRLYWRAHQVSLHHGIELSHDLLLFESEAELDFIETVVENVDLSALNTYPTSGFGVVGMAAFLGDWTGIAGVIIDDFYPQYYPALPDDGFQMAVLMTESFVQYAYLTSLNIIGINSTYDWFELEAQALG